MARHDAGAVLFRGLSTRAWLGCYDPSYSALTTRCVFGHRNRFPWNGDADWAVSPVIMVNVWYGDPVL